MKHLVRRFRRLLMGSEVQRRIGDLEYRVRLLEEVLALGNEGVWLYQNREERMDASLPIFDEKRRRFHIARYEFAARYVRGAKVADIACGTGYGTRLLVEQGGALHATGVDTDAEAIAYAGRRHGVAGTSFVHAPAESAPIPEGSLDAIVSMETIEHVDDDRSLLRTFRRLLKPGGLLICSTPNAWPLELCKHHLRSYDLAGFREALEEHFEVSEMWNQNSGSDSPFNHGQPAGIRETTASNCATAECFIAVCSARS